MSRNQDEAVDYDLSSTGTIAEVNAGADKVGVRIEATGSASYEIEVEGHDAGPFTEATFSAVSSVDTVVEVPEAVYVRVKNTSTASETADALVGGTNE